MIIEYKFNHKHLNHPQGQCFFNKEQNLAYLNIPKNASTSAKIAFVENKYLLPAHISCVNNDTKILVILRDPFERWFSGVFEFLQRRILSKKFDSKLDKYMIKLLVEQILFDEHTELQTYFLNGVNIKQCVFFYCDLNLSNNMAHYVNMPFPNKQHNNQLTDIKKTEPFYAAKQQLYNYVVKKKKIEIIKKFYNDDYKLINYIKTNNMFYDMSN